VSGLLVTGAQDVWLRAAARLGSADRRLRYVCVGAELAASAALVLWSVPALPGSAGWQALLLASGLGVGARATAVAAGAREWGDSWPVVQVCAVALVAVAGLVPGGAAGPVASGPAYVLLVAATAAWVPASASTLLVAGCAAGQLAAVVLAGSGLDAWLLQVAATALVAVLVGSLRSHRALLRELVDHELTDPVTGLPGQRYLLQALRAEVDRAREQVPLAVLTVLVDNLAEIDREHGASVGNDVLARLAARLRHVLPDAALLARAGDDRLAVVAPATDAALAWELAADLRGAAHRPGDGLPDVVVRVAVVVVQGGEKRDPEALLDLAAGVTAAA
jgi:diguanylate cyclase (GGDEF)-like protein